MVSIVTKKINGRAYLYLVESVRNKTKVVQKTIKYIGKKRPVSKHELNCMSLSYKREDWVLKTFQEYLSYQDHELLKNASENQYEYLKTLDKISREKQKEKFLSQFISDSNAIEGSTLSTKDTFNYLFNDITPTGHNKKELFMAHNLLKAWEYVEKNKKRLPTKKDLLILHKLVNMDIEENKTLGKFKNIQNYVGDVYTTSFLFTEERLGELLRWIRKAFRKINDFEVAFQSHAQFEIITPLLMVMGE